MNTRARALARFVCPLLAACACAVLLATQPAGAQPRLPPPEATDPVARGLMQGAPPAPDKRVTLANILAYPNARWAFHHLRQLGPTTAVWRGDAPPSALPRALQDLDGLAFTRPDGQRSTIADWQRSTYTDALLVLHQGRVVFERYGAGMRPEQPHALWSMSKSLVGLLATLLVDDGTLDPRAPLPRALPELAGSAWADATLQDTLDMSTAVAYRETFTDPTADVHRYLRAAGLLVPPAGTAPGALHEYLPTLARDGEHGRAFRYKSVDTEVVAWLLRRVTGQPLAQLLSDRVWRPLGAEEDAYYWVDPVGAEVGSVGLVATARDLARLGEALRNDGRVGSRQVFSATAMRRLREGADPAKFAAGGPSPRAGYAYRNFWWIPGDADGSFEAKGLFGQHLHVNPAAGVVIVKFSSHPVPDTVFTHGLDRAAFAAIAAALRR